MSYQRLPLDCESLDHLIPYRPRPNAVRTHARCIWCRHYVVIPDNSPLPLVVCDIYRKYTTPFDAEQCNYDCGYYDLYIPPMQTEEQDAR